MEKQFDLMSIMLKNPNAKTQDILSSGIDMDNMGLDTEANYVKMSDVQNDPRFKDYQGKFSPTKFHQVYVQAQSAYNYFQANNPYKPSKYDLFADPGKVDNSPTFSVQEINNPYRITHGLTGLNEEGPRTLSIEEIAQTRPVYNITTKKWEKAPNDSFLDLLDGDTRVLAQYDSNGTHIDPITGQTIEHNKGDYKTDSSGTFYYETLGGRNIDGKSVLHLSDVLTTDGSTMNAVDFLDSDGLTKSPVSSLIKNAALIGSMFLPYVGPVIAGIAVTQQAMKLGSVIGKMITNSNSPQLNNLEGLAEATDFHNGKSEYAKDPNNIWCWENLIDLFGDSIGQLREQRLLFKYMPALFKGKAGITAQSDENFLAEKYLKEIEKANEFKMDDYLAGSADLTNAKLATQAKNVVQAQAKADKYMKDYYNLGGYISKAYMTGITVEDMFQEAKNNGASDTVASALTLGYAAAEYALLSKGIGEWILPELRANKGQAKAINNALANTLKDSLSGLNAEAAKTTTKVAKNNFFQKVFNIGKSIANADYAVGKKSFLSVAATGLGEGTEEVTEEMLADTFRKIYDTANWLSGKQTHMLNMNGWTDRYLMNFLGGLAGGTVNAAASDFKQFKHWDNMSERDALQQYIYLKANKESDQVRKTLDKLDLGSKTLSMNLSYDDNGNVIGWEAAKSKEDSQDSFIKGRIKQQLDLIDSVVDSAYDGGEIYHDLSDKDILDSNTLHDLRLAQFKNSATAGRLIEKFQSTLTDYVQTAMKLNSLNTPEVKAENNEGDQKGEKSPALEADRKQLQLKLNSLKTDIKDLVEGKNTPMFVAEAIMESSPLLKQAFQTAGTLDMYVKNTTGKHINELSEEQLEQKKQEYEQYVNTKGKDANEQAIKNFLDLTEKVSSQIIPKIEEYQKAVNPLDKVLEQQYRNNYNFLEGENFLNNTKNILNIDSLEDANQLAEALGDQDYIDQFNVQKDLYNSLADNTPDKQKVVLEMSYKASAYQVSKINDIIDIYKKQGYINPITKTHLQKIANNTLNDLNNIAYAVDSLAENNGVSTDQTQVNNINTFINTLYKSNDLETVLPQMYTDIEKLNNNIQDLDKINNSPIEQLLNTFLLNQTGDPTLNASSILADFNNILLSKDNVTSTFDSLKLVRANQLRKALSLTAAYIHAARVDNAGYSPITLLQYDKEATSQNLWGINKTLNDVAKRNGNKEFKELPTIDGKVADAILQDIHLISQRLNVVFKINSINQSKKLQEFPKIQANLNLLKYKAIRLLYDTAPDQWDVTDLQSLDPIMQEIDNLSKSETDQRLNLEAKILTLEKGLYNFFQKNSDRDLKELIPAVGNIWNNNLESLTSSTDTFDAKTTWWYFSAIAAIDPEVYQKEYYNTLEKSDIAAIPGQEFDAYLQYANAVNGDKISEFYKALHDYMSIDFINASVENRKKKLQDSGFSESNVNFFAADENAVFIENLDILPRFDNITVCEGVPGAGKTYGASKITINMLKNNEQTKLLLDNVYVVRPTLNGAETFAKDVLQLEHYEAFDIKSFLQRISSNYGEGPTINSKTGYYDYTKADFTIDEENKLKQIKTTLTSNKLENPPSLIIIDEITRLSDFEVQALRNFAKEYGISIMAYGDFEQSRAHGNIEIFGKGATTDTVTSINNFIHGIKIGTSLRTQNTQKNVNLAIMQTNSKIIREDKNITANIQLHYYLGPDKNGKKVLNGERVINVENEKLPLNVSEITDTIETMINSLNTGQHIGYIYQNETSEIYDFIINKHKEWADKIIPYKGNSAQGDEAQYFIIEPPIINNVQSKSNKVQYIEDLYTAVTRSAQGSLILGPNVVIPGTINLTNIQDKVTQEETIAGAGATEEQIQKVIKTQSGKRKSDLNEILKDREIADVTYTKRSSFNKPTEVITTPQEETKSEPLAPTNEPKPKPAEETHKEVIKSEDKSVKTQLNITNVKITQNDNIISITFDGIKVNSDWLANNLLNYTTDISTKIIKQFNCLEDGQIYVIFDDESTGILKTSLEEATNGKLKVPPHVAEIQPEQAATDVQPQVKETNSENLEDAIIPHLFSFSSFELGNFGVDENGLIQPLGTNNLTRIDSLHGLIKILNNGKLPTTYEEQEKLLNILAKLNNLARHAKSKADLVQKIKLLLNVDIGAISFGYKQNIIITDSNSKYLQSNGDNLDFFKKDSTKEKSYHNLIKDVETGEEKTESDTNPHQIVMLVRDSSGKSILEIPLFNLPSPITLIQVKDKDGNFMFGDLFNAYNNIHADNIHEKLAILEQNTELLKKYPIISKLIQLYNGANGKGYASYQEFSDDWMPSNYQDNGIVAQNVFGINTNDISHIYYGTTSLSKQAKDPRKVFSQQVFIPYGTEKIIKLGLRNISDPLRENNETLTQDVELGTAGFPFVLVSDYPGVNSSNILDVWKYDKAYNTKNPENPIYRVSEIKVIPPEITMDEYLAGIHEFVTNTSLGNKAPLGNTITCFKILYSIQNQLDALLQNKKIPLTIDELKIKLEELAELYYDRNYRDVITELVKPLGDGKNTLERSFMNIINLITYSGTIQNDSWVVNTDAVNIIKDNFKNTFDNTSINLKASIDRASSGTLRYADQSNYRTNYKVNGIDTSGEWLVSAKLETSQKELTNEEFNDLILKLNVTNGIKDYSYKKLTDKPVDKKAEYYKKLFKTLNIPYTDNAQKDLEQFVINENNKPENNFIYYIDPRGALYKYTSNVEGSKCLEGSIKDISKLDQEGIIKIGDIIYNVSQETTDKTLFTLSSNIPTSTNSSDLDNLAKGYYEQHEELVSEFPTFEEFLNFVKNDPEAVERFDDSIEFSDAILDYVPEEQNSCSIINVIKSLMI